MENLIGYLSPKGKFYKCSYWGHMEEAEKICKTVYNETKNSVFAEDFLVSKGWVIFYARNVFFAKCNEDGFKLLSKQQKYFLMDAIKSCEIDSKINDLKEILTTNDKLQNEPHIRISYYSDTEE